MPIIPSDFPLLKFPVILFLVILMNNMSEAFSNTDHLIVLCHGLNGDHRELAYLERKILSISNSKVLNSKRNNGDLSKLGVETCAMELADEIRAEVNRHSGIKRISLIGMSLGGLIQRGAAKILFDPDENTIAGLKPDTFMAIASPFLGSKSGTYLPLPRWVETIIAENFGKTGRDLFHIDESDPLIYKMCTEEKYLAPLRAFKRRRLYAAITNDFMVPVSTAAFIDRESLEDVRSSAEKKKGIIAVTNSSFEEADNTGDPNSITCRECDSLPINDREYRLMRTSLNALGWEKVFVNFDTILPVAHFQICANERYNEFVGYCFGVDAGREIMDDASSYLCS